MEGKSHDCFDEGVTKRLWGRVVVGPTRRMSGLVCHRGETSCRRLPRDRMSIIFGFRDGTGVSGVQDILYVRGGESAYVGRPVMGNLRRGVVRESRSACPEK